MTRHMILPGLAALALASCALPMFVMADEGGGGGGGARTYSLTEAFALLDPSVDTDWNRGGQPSVERLQALTGNKTLSRAEIAAAAPDLDRERAPKIASKPEPAKAPAQAPAAASGDEPPAWAKALFDKIEEQGAAIADLTERNESLTMSLADAEERMESRTTADEVVDGDLPPELRGLDPMAQNSGQRPPAAPTPLAMTTATGDSANIAGLHPARSVAGRMSKRWPGGNGEPLKDVEVVAIAVGQYPAQPGKLRFIGERFVFSGVPGSWFVPANSPQLPQFLSGELSTVDAERLWGLKPAMSIDA